MNLLICAATEFEIAPFLEHIKLKSYEVDVLVGGVGMIATAYALGKKLAEKKYDAILSIGIAGSFDKTIALGDVVRVQSDTFSELGAEDDKNFLSIEDMGLAESAFFENAAPFLGFSSVAQLKCVKSITVNTVHGNQDSIDCISERLNPEIENMEGASVFYAAQQNGIYCLQIRSISNYVEKRDRSHWQIEMAIQNLNNWLIGFMSEINQKNYK